MPARNWINKNFYNAIEKHAAAKFGQISSGSEKIPGWYRITVALYPGGHEDTRYPGTVNHPKGEFPAGFPMDIKAQWGLYQPKGGRRKRSDPRGWKELKASMTHSYPNFERPPIPGVPRTPINLSREKNVTLVKNALQGESTEFAEAIIDLAPFSGINDLVTRMKSYRNGSKSHNRFQNLDARLEIVKSLYPAHFTL
ncbi:hypothetical protein JBE27_35370 [Streptomyces albiflaviniger]|nr:hypothetical protein [Streptomyces albiflaviniger]